MSDISIAETNPAIRVRSPAEVMRLNRMGSFHPMRLSFSRQLIRRMHDEGWMIDAPRVDLDENGFGVAVIRATTPDHVYSLVAYSHDLSPERRSDRVIADAWDATFTLYDGEPDAATIAAMHPHVSTQEEGRHRQHQLTLSRANKSVRMFDHVVSCLAEGRQPDAGMVNRIGYLMRTTAVYGNGKFGISDRDRFKNREAMAAPFMAEMLTVYLIRHFSLLLVDHLARGKGGDRAIGLDPMLARHFGIGNATGLGMAPFLVNHQALLHQWMEARETALARVMAIRAVGPDQHQRLCDLVERAQQYTAEWRVDDAVQMDRITRLDGELVEIAAWIKDPAFDAAEMPIKALFDRAAVLSVEAQEMLVSIVLEPFGDLIDDLGAMMAAREAPQFASGKTVAELTAVLDKHYRWALDLDLDDPEQSRLFWYTSAAKLEPRLGNRYEEDGAECEFPFDIPHQVQALHRDLAGYDSATLLADVMLRQPEHRFMIRRAMTTADAPYGEIADNLVAASTRPIDMLRCKLSFFGASKFDPKSDLWTRITLYQGAPLAAGLADANADDWLFSSLG
ncbi:MAG: hypothetical protein ACON4P_05390 [Candidatus Puniceispirillales bacterium]